METPLLNKSCVRVVSIHTGRVCGVNAIARAGWGRNGLSTWTGSIMREKTQYSE